MPSPERVRTGTGYSWLLMVLHDLEPAQDIRCPSPTATLDRLGLPRVLYVVALDPGHKFGSLEEQIVLLAERFQTENGLLLPLFVERSGLRRHAIPQARHRCPLSRPRRFSLGKLRQLTHIVQQHGIDVINWNFMPSLKNAYVWALSLLAPRVQHWFTDHNSRPAVLPSPPVGLRKLIKRFLCKRYHRVVCVSRFVRDCLETQGIWSNLVCLPHFINTDRFRPDPAARGTMRRAMNAEGRFVLLTVGQLIKDKGVDVAVRALAKLPAEVVLWIVGAGPEEDHSRS